MGKEEKPSQAEKPRAPRRAIHRHGGKGSSMEKWLCWGALGTSGLVGLLFLLDLIVKFPFAGASKSLDIIVILAAGLIAYLSWDTLREIK